MAPPPFYRSTFGPGSNPVISPSGQLVAPPPQVIADADIPHVQGVLEVTGHHKNVQCQLLIQGVFEPHRS